MDFQTNKNYKIIIEINTAILTYYCKVISDDDDSVTFIDNRNKTYTYNKRCVLSSTELEDGELR